jgi:hypothetical protein
MPFNKVDNMQILDLAKEIAPIVASFVTCELLKEGSSLVRGTHKLIGKKRIQLKNALQDGERSWK